MKVTLHFVGMIQKVVDWKKKIELDLPENTTLEDALKEVGIDWKKTKEFGFVLIDKKKISDKDFLLTHDSIVKVFPKSFGG